MDFKEIVESRYAAKKFDGKEIPKEKLDELFEMIRFAPSSANIQPWKIKVISDAETKGKLLEASLGQEQVTTCSHLLVFCADKNILGNLDKLLGEMLKAGTPEDKVKGYEKMIRPFLEAMDPDEQRAWAQRQMYIALGNAVNGARSLGFDSCPMEGFKPDEYSKILNLPDNLVPTALVTIGYAADESRPKVRFKKEDVFF